MLLFASSSRTICSCSARNFASASVCTKAIYHRRFGRLPFAARGLIASFGIHGLKASYYMAYDEPGPFRRDAAGLWALASALLHGVTSTPIMNWSIAVSTTKRNEKSGSLLGQRQAAHSFRPCRSDFSARDHPMRAHLIAALRRGLGRRRSPSATIEYRSSQPAIAFALKWAYGVSWFGGQKGTSMPRQLLWIGYCTLVGSLLATACFAIPDHGPTRDADHGRTLVNRWCVSCHLVGIDQKQATTDAPPFATIAKKPDFDAAKLAFFLLDPHPKMPDMQLSRDETSDIAAYIATLK